MGTCGGCIAHRQRKGKPIENGKPIQLICPICMDNLNTDDHKPFIVCENSHMICRTCYEGLRQRAALLGRIAQCPFCKKQIIQDLVITDAHSYRFLKEEKETLEKLPQNRKKLFAFSVVYLPKLHRNIKEWQRNPGMEDEVEKIDILYIRGKMVEDYQEFEMEMLSCLPRLRALYLNQNQVKSIDTSEYNNNKLQILDASKNLLPGMRVMLIEGSAIFKNLRVLNLQSNLIDEIGGLQNMDLLQVLNLGSNKITKMANLDGCINLKDLNLERNSITNLEYYNYFRQIRGLSMYGNQISGKEWIEFLQRPFDELRLLTMSTTEQYSEKILLHARIRKMKWKYLQLVLSEVSQDEPEKTNQIDENGLKFEKLTVVELNILNYDFHIQQSKTSFLIKALKQAKHYDRLGENLNFKPVYPVSKVYEFNDNRNIIKRISQPEVFQPIFHSYKRDKVVPSTPKTKRFIRFESKTNKIILGMCERTRKDDNSLQLDVDTGILVKENDQIVIPNWQRMNEDEQNDVIWRFDSVTGQVDYLINGNVKLTLKLKRPINEMRLYVVLKDINTEIKIIKLELI